MEYLSPDTPGYVVQHLYDYFREQLSVGGNSSLENPFLWGDLEQDIRKLTGMSSCVQSTAVQISDPIMSVRHVVLRSSEQARSDVVTPSEQARNDVVVKVAWHWYSVSLAEATTTWKEEVMADMLSDFLEQMIRESRQTTTVESFQKSEAFIISFPEDLSEAVNMQRLREALNRLLICRLIEDIANDGEHAKELRGDRPSLVHRLKGKYLEHLEFLSDQTGFFGIFQKLLQEEVVRLEFFAKAIAQIQSLVDRYKYCDLCAFEVYLLLMEA